MKNILLVFLVTVMCLFGIPGMIEAKTGPGPDPADATYTGVYETPITLKNGHWQGKPFTPGGASRPTAGLVRDFILKGDLNGDETPEQVVFLWESEGGSGVYYFLSVLTVRDGKLVNVATTEMGDRIQVMGGKIEKGEIRLDVIQHGPKDPACCPSQKATQVWKLKGKKLIKGKTLVKGNLTLKDLEGGTWVLQRLKRKGQPLEGATVTLRFANGKLQGKGFCNRYFAKVENREGMAGSIHIGPVGSTKMSCSKAVMQMERRYFDALSGVMSYSFLFGKLALTWQKGKKVDAMVFVPQKALDR